MSFSERLIEFHSSSRPIFILFMEFAAFVGSMATIVGLGFVRELLS
jgi:hypothetical protein